MVKDIFSQTAGIVTVTQEERTFCGRSFVRSAASIWWPTARCSPATGR